MPPTRSNAMSVCGCVKPHLRSRVTAALRGFAVVRWADSFDEVEQWVADQGADVVILSATDPDGGVAGATATSIARRRAGIPIVLYAPHDELAMGALSSPHITDLLVVGEGDSRLSIQSALLDAVHRAAADRVVEVLRERLSGSLAAVAELAVRHPSRATVEEITGRLGVHRQTVASWCRKERFLRPEELIMWCRLLLASALLERTDRSVTVLAIDLDFPSTVSLRNQLKRYTGMTAMEIRAAGLPAVLAILDASVGRARSGRTANHPEGSRSVLAEAAG